MKKISFSISPNSQTQLQTIELLRRDILATPLSPKTELRLRFESTVGRIHGIMTLSGITISKNDVVKELTATPSRQKNTLITTLKNTLTYISGEWTVNPRSITFATLEHLAQNLGETERIGKIFATELSHAKDELRQLLEFLESSHDHPVTSATIAFLQSIAIAPLGSKTAQFSFGLFFLYLHKYGYDLRGTASVLPYWMRDLRMFTESLLEAQKTGNDSPFLSYAIQQFAAELEEKMRDLGKNQWGTTAPAALFTLTDRQKEILSLLDDPSTGITNRAVQKHFRISQITASRELSRLSSLGLLYPHGKGRSVYYTKI